MGQNAEPIVIIIPEQEQKIMEGVRLSSLISSGAISPNNYEKASKKIITHFENNGYPFISVSLDSIFLDRDTVWSTLSIERNNYICFDSIILKGDLKLSQSYLRAYLGFKKNKPYNESIIKQIPQLLSELPFAMEALPSGVEFVGGSAYLYLFLNKRRVNQFDGYLGIVPVNEKNGKVSLSGELNLHLRNIFSIGETLDLQWRSTERYSQFLYLHGEFPYLFRTPLGVDGKFTLDKKDTNFINMNYILSLIYSFKGNNYLKTYFDYTTSHLISTQAMSLSENSLFLDYNKAMYGIELRIRKLDFIYNPKKGYYFLLNGSVGRRNIVKNNAFEESFYDNVDMTTLRYRVLGEINGYIPLHKKWVLVLGAKGGAIFGKDVVLNELFRIGGMNFLQGFDDLSIWASSYAIGNIEGRFLFSKLGYINAFFNGAWVERNLTKGYSSDFPFGFGIGIAFDTKAGLFYLSYALGKQKENPISFKTGKIHFGLALRF